MRDSHVPLLDPIAHFVVLQGHAHDSINRLEGKRHGREGIAHGGGGEGKIVGVSASTSLEKPWTMRFRWKSG